MRSPMSDRGRQRLRTIITIIATALVIAPAAALAGHQFTDVPDSNVFHDDIEWMRDNGVTVGCNPPVNDEYCPGDNVTREQMAAFMHRLETENVFVRPGQDAVDGGNADTVDGKHASDFLGATAKAVDSDKLDGKDSSAFLGATEQATDSDTVDGKHASDFLGATEQATDSDTLDGMDSSAFVPSAQVLPYTVTFDSPGEKTIATSGPLSLVAVCNEGNLDGEGDGDDQNLIVEYRSTADDWIQAELGLLGSADTHGLLDLTVLDTSDPAANELVSFGGARSADGHYLGQDDYHSIATLNHGGHLCVVSGVAFLQGPPA